ncbi:hypothetical protein [Butyrivibrio sp. LB2008]|uniref:hypothetical protein n=1 Tax=Butyrivibrio sp. LB2008 TaxID=1408305 RepID=UPI00047B86B6|nr:hypothetical protein [Butyrivibrio sp. LB2008]
MGICWDTKKVNDFIEYFEHAVHNYMEPLAAARAAYEKYENNETFVGQAAEKSKTFIGLKQKEVNRQQYELSKEMLKKYTDLDETFKVMVDPAADARIDTDVVKKVQARFQGQLEGLERSGFNIQQKSMDVFDRLSKYGCGVEEVYFRNTIVKYDDYCGTGGFLQDCIRKMEDFDDEASRRVINSGLKNAIIEHIDEVSEITAGLDLINPQAVEIDKQKVSLMALGASVNSLNPFSIPFYPPGLHSIPIKPKPTKLEEELKAISDRDMTAPQKIKDSIYDDARALNKVFSLDAYIESASKKYHVDKAMIQAVLFREIRCYGYDDPLGDAQVRQTYAYEHKKEEYDEWLSNIDPKNYWKKPSKQPPTRPLKYRSDSSTGVGQIFGKTAIDSYNLHYGTNYDRKNWKDVEFFWNKLQDEEFNVEMAALVLCAGADEFGYDINNLSTEQQRVVFTRYNGDPENPMAIAYGYTVQDYYNAFSEYNN